VVRSLHSAEPKPNMIALSTYDVVKLWDDGEFVLSRGTHTGQPSVLVLGPAFEQVTANGMARLQRAFSLRDELQSSWAARPLALIDHHGRPALISEDPGFELLTAEVGRRRSIPEFLRIALGIARALRQMHERGLIHKDIKPAHVFFDPSSGNAWLTGFGIASRLPRERQLPEAPEIIAGTLAYMAPEQTGRMNRSIDSRTDLYALGVSLYELFSGELPFSATDPMEWVHCHIARQATPLHRKLPGVPRPISDIVTKLLAKTAEGRYQTARGVEHDLRRALHEWESSGAVREFVPGGSDASDRLLMPEKLYGRDADIEVLVASLERVVATGETQLVLVSGYSGIGKSSVVSELHKVLVPPRGLFASGKFDQYQRDIPYSTLAQAFRVLIRHVLGKSDAEVAVWRDQLLRALGSSGALISNLVPELDLVIGKQPPTPEVSPHEAQTRFQSLVRQFLAVFAQAEHPLALFLDDLQWLDSATLELLEHLIGDPAVKHLLLVGAYRDNEVDAAHPLAATLARLRHESRRVREIVLTPLAVGDVAALCSDALHVDPLLVEPLAELVHEKAGGNPFFAIQFITTLVDEGLLSFEPEQARWQWDVDAIRAKGFTDNVAVLMALKLHRLEPLARNALRQLACIGHTGSTARLSLVYGVSEEAIHQALQSAVLAGLVLRSPAGYAFLHDRVHEAAYALVPEVERAAEHLRIGWALAAETPPGQLEENVFEIVNHLNRGLALLESQEQRDRLAELNRLASQRAKASIANAAAHAYARVGRTLLGASGWERKFRLCFELELLLADCEFVQADLQAAELRLEQLGNRAITLTDRAAVIFIQANLYTAMVDRADRAVAICLDYLRHVGIEWTAHPSEQTVREEYRQLLLRLDGRSIDDLLNLPVLTDPDRIATIEVLLGMFTPAFNYDRGLTALLLLRMGNLGLEHGNTDAAALGYAFLGMVLGSAFGDFRTGFLFGKLARDLVEQRGLGRYSGRVHHTLGTHVLAWTQPISAAEASLRRGLKTLQVVGDVTYVSFAHIGILTMMLASGQALDRVQSEAEDALALVRRGKFEIAIDAIVGHLRLIRALRGQLPDPCTLHDGRNPSTDYTRLSLSRGWYWIRTMQACFIYGNYSAALAAYRNAHGLFAFSASFFELTEYHFFGALVCAACFDDASGEERASYRAALADHRAELATWADNCQENFAHRVALIDAELARIDDRPLDAMNAYERAIALSRAQGLVHNEAIACERAALFYGRRGFETISHAYLQKARSGYLRWGATGKVGQLDGGRRRVMDGEGTRPPSAIDAPSAELDLATVVKSSQAVTGEVGLENLIETLMMIALEHAGADRGLLVLPRAGELYVEAKASAREGVGVTVSLPSVVARHPELPETLLHYVSRTQELVLLDDAQGVHSFDNDPYLLERKPRSVVCIPLVKQAELVGLLYLENHLTSHVFTSARISVLKLLASQVATSLQNASLEEKNATLAEKESLLKEVHHRVKNNLQLISSLLNLQSSRIKDPAVAELFADSRNRVRSMALVHENLYRAGNFAKIPMANHIRALCAELTRAYSSPGCPIEVVIEVGDLHLDMNRAVACGLIVNELVSNALKHAFPAGHPGRVQVCIEALGAGRHVLRVQDDGSGLPEGFDFGRADSLGLQLVGDLTRQLRGTLCVLKDPGTTFAITFEEASTPRRAAP